MGDGRPETGDRRQETGDGMLVRVGDSAYAGVVDLALTKRWALG